MSARIDKNMALDELLELLNAERDGLEVALSLVQSKAECLSLAERISRETSLADAAFRVSEVAMVIQLKALDVRRELARGVQ